MVVRWRWAGVRAQQRDLAADRGDPRRRRLIAASSLILDSPSRVLMAIYALALVLCGLALREPARRHAEVLIDAAGLAIAWIAAGPFCSTTTALPLVWQVLVLGAGFGLVAFGAVDRSPGPAYLGVANLVLFILVVGDNDETWGGGRSSCSPAGSRCSSPDFVPGDRCRRARPVPRRRSAARGSRGRGRDRRARPPRLGLATRAPQPVDLVLLAHDQVLHQVLERFRARLLAE